jgi:hypothetical protein
VGHWESLETPWWETNIVNCSFCGQMIPRREWVSEHDGRRRVFCGPECEGLYVDYWIPRHGHTWPGELGDRARS